MVHAQETAEDAAQETISDAEECPRLFGTDTVRADNRARRESALLWAETERGGRIEITHNTHWKRPRPTIIRGVELIDVEDDGAVVEVGERYEHLCPPGRYRVEVDDALGRDNKVLALVGDVVLLETDDRLTWLGEPDDDYQNWRMNWASWWTQPAPRMANPVTVVTGSKSRSRARRGKRNRNRNRYRRNRRNRRR